MSQTTYLENPLPAVAGNFDSTADYDIATRVKPIGGNFTDIPYGRAVMEDFSNPPVGETVALYDGTTVVLGVAARDLSNANDDADAYTVGDMVPVLSRGVVYVLVDDDVTPASSVFVRKSGSVERFTVTWSADFVAANVINGSVDGEAIEAVTYAATHDATMLLVAAAIQALDNVATATVTGAREITVTGATSTKGEVLSSESTFTVTLGASQATDTIANVYGPSASNDIGSFRADADTVNGTATAVALSQAKFLGTAAAGDVVLLDINLP